MGVALYVIALHGMEGLRYSLPYGTQRLGDHMSVWAALIMAPQIPSHLEVGCVGIARRDLRAEPALDRSGHSRRCLLVQARLGLGRGQRSCGPSGLSAGVLTAPSRLNSKDLSPRLSILPDVPNFAVGCEGLVDSDCRQQHCTTTMHAVFRGVAPTLPRVAHCVNETFDALCQKCG